MFTTVLDISCFASIAHTFIHSYMVRLIRRTGFNSLCQPTDIDDAQCVPDTAIQGSLYPRKDRMIASPVAYAYPSNLAIPAHIGAAPVRSGDQSRPVTSARHEEQDRVELLTRETSRLDDELQMEFSEL